MGLRVFSLFMLAMLLAFIPAEIMRRELWRIGRGSVGVRLAELNDVPLPNGERFLRGSDPIHRAPVAPTT